MKNSENIKLLKETSLKWVKEPIMICLLVVTSVYIALAIIGFSTWGESVSMLIATLAVFSAGIVSEIESIKNIDDK